MTHECEIYANKYLPFLDKLLARSSCSLCACILRTRSMCRCFCSYFDTNIFFRIFYCHCNNEIFANNEFSKWKEFSFKNSRFLLRSEQNESGMWNLKVDVSLCCCLPYGKIDADMTYANNIHNRRYTQHTYLNV